MLKTIKKYPLTLLLVVVIFYLSLMDVPEVEIPDVSFFDKWVHFVMYGSLTSMLYTEKMYSLHKAKAFPLMRGITTRHLALFTLLPSLMGGLLELLQAYCTNGHRSGDWLDFLANATGAVIITTIIVVIKLRVKN